MIGICGLITVFVRCCREIPVPVIGTLLFLFFRVCHGNHSSKLIIGKAGNSCVSLDIKQSVFFVIRILRNCAVFIGSGKEVSCLVIGIGCAVPQCVGHAGHAPCIVVSVCCLMLQRICNGFHLPHGIIGVLNRSSCRIPYFCQLIDAVEGITGNGAVFIRAGYPVSHGVIG